MIRRPAGVLGPVSDACITLTACPPMKMNDEREVEDVFAAIV